MKKHALSISYVILLTLCMPLACLYMWFLTVLPVSWEAVNEWADTFPKWLFYTFVLLLPVGVYWLTVLVLGILNIARSFNAYKSGDAVGCVNGMLIHKYGLVVFFVVNFIVLVGIYLLVTLGLVMGTRGIFLVLAPFFLPWLVAAVGFTVFTTWLAIIPGAFYGIQVIRFTYREKKTSAGAAVWHGVLQFIFLADVLDAMYLAVKKWGRGKKSSIVIAVLYTAGLSGIIWMIIKIAAL